MLEDEGFYFILDGWGSGRLLVFAFQLIEEDSVVVEALFVVGFAEEVLGCFGDEVKGEVKAANLFLHHGHKYAVVDGSHIHRGDFLLKINHLLESVEYLPDTYLGLGDEQPFLAGFQLQIVPFVGVGLFCQIEIFL